MLPSSRRLLQRLRPRLPLPLRSLHPCESPPASAHRLHPSRVGTSADLWPVDPPDAGCGGGGGSSDGSLLALLCENSSQRRGSETLAGGSTPRDDSPADQRPLDFAGAASGLFQVFFRGRAASALLHGRCDGQAAAAAAALRRGIATRSARPAAWNETDAEDPVRSPLSQAPGPLAHGGRRRGARAVEPAFERTADAVLTGIKQSPQKLNLVAALVRGMRVEDALAQLAVSVKRAAKTVSKVVQSAQANAVHNFGLQKDQLVVREAFVGKDRYLHRVMPHGKGRAGKLEHPRSRLTVIVKEMSEEEQADLARLRLLKRQGKRMTLAEVKLVPHRMVETQWSRQRKSVVDAAESGEPQGG